MPNQYELLYVCVISEEKEKKLILKFYLFYWFIDYFILHLHY